MKKFPVVVLFVFVLIVSCSAPDQNKVPVPTQTPAQSIATDPPKTESVLIYFCDPDTETICYRDLASDQPEASFPVQGYFFTKWASPEKVFLSKYSDSGDSEEYYAFDPTTKSATCITCSLNSASYKLLSPSTQKVLLIKDNDLSIADVNNPGSIESLLSEKSISWLDWSPDDAFLVFAESMHLYRLNIKDRSLTDLLPGTSALQIFSVGISPAGDQVAFYLLDEDKNFSLAAVAVDGTGFQVLADLTPREKRMIDSENASTSYAWSPSGKEIAFTAHLEDYADFRSGIFIVDLDQRKPRLILDSPTIKFSPAWSPDGSLIAFVDQGSPQDIWTIAPDGTNLTNQTNTPERLEYGPAWK